MLSLKAITQINDTLQFKPHKAYKAGYLRLGLSLFTSWLSNDDDKVVIFPALTVTPGLNLVQGKNFSAAITFPISVGFSIKTNTYFGVDLPGMFEINIGSAAGNNENSNLGFMLGAGGAYHYSENYYLDDYDRVKSDFWGYRFHFGVSWGKDFSGDKTLLLVSYGRGISDNRKNIIGIGIFMVMGYKNK